MSLIHHTYSLASTVSPHRKFERDPAVYNRRPLAPELLNYAALDVITLSPVSHGLAADHASTSSVVLKLKNVALLMNWSG